MADKTITQLDPVVTQAGADELPMMQSGFTYKTTVQKILDWIRTQVITWTAAARFDGNVVINGFTNGAFLGMRVGFAPNVSGGAGLMSSDVAANGNADGLAVYGHDGVAVYVAQALVAKWLSNGFLDNTGLLRATGNGAPTTGVGAALDYGSIANTGRFFVYDFTGAVYKNAQVEGLTVRLAPNGTIAFTASPNTNTSNNADVVLDTAGRGLKIKEGSNARMGVATLVGGTVTVANTSVTANSRIFLTGQADGGTPGAVRVSSRVAGTSFTITSTNGADTSTIAFHIVEPSP